MPSAPDSRVEVVPYSETWPTRFAEEQDALAKVVGSRARSIEHIGSTAVPGLAAKPTIDILMVADDPAAVLERLDGLESLGYQYRPNRTVVGNDEHRFLRKVHQGRRTHHLHVVRTGSAEIDSDDPRHGVHRLIARRQGSTHLV